MADESPIISPGLAMPRMILRPSLELIESLTLPSSKKKTLEGSCSSLIKTVARHSGGAL